MWILFTRFILNINTKFNTVYYYRIVFNVKIDLYAPSDAFTQKVVASAQAKVLPDIYGILDKKEVFAKLEDVKMTNTWTNVAKQYMEVINNVNKSDARPKRFR